MNCTTKALCELQPNWEPWIIVHKWLCTKISKSLQELLINWSILYHNCKHSDDCIDEDFNIWLK